MSIYFQGILVKVIHKGHRVKVKVTGTKSVKSHPATAFRDRNGAVSLQLHWRQVHLSHSRYEATRGPTAACPPRVYKGVPSTGSLIQTSCNTCGDGPTAADHGAHLAWPDQGTEIEWRT